jgi:O-acetyl-ADP-ribose deacetylase (regulator of RNase III)
VWRGGRSGEADQLASAYRAALVLAADHGLHSIAFPAISTGIYGFPLADATRIAVATAREAGLPPLERVVFACFSDQALAAYQAEGVDA